MTEIDAAPPTRQSRPDRFASPSTSHLSSRHRSPPSSRHVAMGRGRSRDSRDGSRGRARSDLNNRDSFNNARPRLRSSSPGNRAPHDDRDRDRGRNRKHNDVEAPVERKYPREYGRHRDRSSDRRGRHVDDSSRLDGSTRDSNFDSGKRHHRSPSPRYRSAANGQHEHHYRDRSFSPSSRKRHRSRSPPSFAPRQKRSRRTKERDRRRGAERADLFGPDQAKPPSSSRTDRPYSPPRRRSPSPRYDEPKRRYHDQGDNLDVPRHRRRTRSPSREPYVDELSTKPKARSRGDSKHRYGSRSPRPDSRQSSFSHTHSPPYSTARPPARGPSDIRIHSRHSSPSHDSTRPNYPPHSPPGGSRRARKKTKQRDEARFVPLASGANSIEVGSFRRGDRRDSFEDTGSYRGSAHGYPEDSHLGEASPHTQPSSPRRGSPHSPSFYNKARITTQGHDAHRPSRSQHSPPISKGSRRTSVGPTERRKSSRSPDRLPTGAFQSQARGRGFSRGGFRGGINSARGGSSDNRSSRQDTHFGHPSYDRRPSSPSRHTSPTRSDHEAIGAGEGGSGSPSRLLHNDQSDSDGERRELDEQMPPPGPPLAAPTGPSGSKFSFAFKTSTKNPVATPKPEISQKFSAAPKKEQPSIVDDRDRDLPKDTPREPASARARADSHHHNRLAERESRHHNRLAERESHHHNRLAERPAPPERPRTRKVIKIQRKLKPKPSLDPELTASKSVYFRKPGNESVIGSGTYGKVFKGKHVYTQKLVALKRIRMEGERDGFPVTAMREVKLLQSLRHPNIVHLYEMMIEHNDCYMVFEYLSHDLTGLLNHPSYKLEAAHKKHLAMQIFEGLDYLHKRGVLHRDIKAANILVSSDGILKLADFGLARFYAKRHQLDYTNRVITIWYRSPELLLGETQYGAAVDIWSAACVMVEIFTRHAIFPGDGGEISQLEKIYNILGTPNRKEWPGLAETPWFELLRPSYRKPNTFAEKYRERLPAAAFDLLAEMFHYDPLKRPSAADVLEHPYFTVEQPPPRQAVELKDIQGDWHEFESKQLRREKERQEKEKREARRAAEKERKRPTSSHDTEPEPKRQHVEGQPQK
ncbi:Pkinase-domain-containing protein [Xylariaceae sp. FL1019]|nr:Pkinase-domain-containing protein [Xylariaceae sp. FL1019]